MLSPGKGIVVAAGPAVDLDDPHEAVWQEEVWALTATSASASRESSAKVSMMGEIANRRTE